jgi:glycosyltransferase involved in cell wall biosynthesis
LEVIPWKSLESYLASEENWRLLLSAGKGFAQRVHFLGRLSHQYLRYLFPCADVAVFPSIVAEAYPLVLMESLANGVLPAASYFSGFAEGLDALIPQLGEEIVDRMRLPIDPATAVEGIADKLVALLSHPGSEDQKAGLRRIAKENYDWSIRADQMLRAYAGFGSKP